MSIVKSLLLAGIVLASLASQVCAQTTIYEGPGTYSTYGNQTYGPGGTQSTYGNQACTCGWGIIDLPETKRMAPAGSSYSSVLKSTSGSDGTTSDLGTRLYHRPNRQANPSTCAAIKPAATGR